MQLSKDKARVRIQSLLNMANDPHANPNEAASMRGIAQKLMTEYDLWHEFEEARRPATRSRKRPPIEVGGGRIEIDIEDIEGFLSLIKAQEQIIDADGRSIAALEKIREILIYQNDDLRFKNVNLSDKLQEMKDSSSKKMFWSYVVILLTIIVGCVSHIIRH